MQKWDNYALSASRAQKLFLGYDQEKMISRFGLQRDADFLYLGFLGELCRISRKTGEIILQNSDRERRAGYNQVMSVFDFLCHDDGPLPPLSGNWASVGSVSHKPQTVGVEPFHLRKYARLFDRDPEKLESACRSLGGRKVAAGDIGCEIPVFTRTGMKERGERSPEIFLSAILKFYRSDEEFDARLTILWDTEVLRFLRYETVFYVEICLCERIILS